MAKTRAQKEQQFAEIQSFLDGKTLVLTGYSRLTVKELTELRNKLRLSDVTLRIVKTTLLAKALTEKGLKLADEVLASQLAVAACAQDEIEPSKIIVDFAKTHEHLAIFGAIVDGQFIDSNQIKQLASLPGREELYSKLVGSLMSPLSGLVNVLSGNIRGLVNILNQLKEQKA